MIRGDDSWIKFASNLIVVEESVVESKRVTVTIMMNFLAITEYRLQIMRLLQPHHDVVAIGSGSVRDCHPPDPSTLEIVVRIGGHKVSALDHQDTHPRKASC
jgi:hypothetical protein